MFGVGPENFTSKLSSGDVTASKRVTLEKPWYSLSRFPTAAKGYNVMCCFISKSRRKEESG